MTDRGLAVGSLLFAVLAAVLYVVAVREPPPPPPPPPTPAPAARVTPRPRKPLKEPARFKASSSEPVPRLPTGTEEEPAPPHVFATVRGRALLAGGSPAPGATVVAYIGGRRKVFAVADDGTFEFRQPGADLRLRAERMDGQLVVGSDWVELDTNEGGEWEVDLVLPEEKRGGLGIRIGEHGDGIKVRAVLPGSPAEELGLRAGDVITALGRESVAGWTTSDFAARMIGDVGSEQRFTVRRADGTEEQLLFERRFLDR